MSDDTKREALRRLLEKVKEKTGKDLTKYIDKVRILEVDGDAEEMSFEQIEKAATSDISEETANKLIEALENEEITTDRVISFRDAIDGWKFRQVLPHNGLPTMSVSYEGSDFSVAYNYSLEDNAMYYIFENESGYNIAISTQIQDDFTPDDIKNAIAILNKHVHAVVDVYNYLIISPEVQDAFLDDIFASLDALNNALSRINNRTSS